MSTFKSADARTALIATYHLSRSPLAGNKNSTSGSVLQPYDINVPRVVLSHPASPLASKTKGTHGTSPFTGRGRTIYNAHTRREAHSFIVEASRRHHRTTILQRSLARVAVVRTPKKAQDMEDMEFNASEDDQPRGEEESSTETDEMSDLRYRTPPRKSSTPNTTPALSPSGSSDSEWDGDLEAIEALWDEETMAKIEDARVQEMFDMFIKADECMGSEEWF
ncbi:hypothetical protein BV22DRAFT_1030666 [Leucogyrophana mollusca]|uniref:Uncharacterized protein n=1 Tax=Leucogyrophana mollusca TaxID=85980 RepID=A0ACB8BRF4_9AGAM|nr:hypothetical protein BV22DRAFT_1030666 [Leucogyrophana mollusca]